MKYYFLLLFLGCSGYSLSATAKDNGGDFVLPDSVKATAFITDITISSVKIKKQVYAGIRTAEVSLAVTGEKNERAVEFSFPSASRIVATGINVEKEKGELEWEYEWKPNVAYKLLIVTAADSAMNFILYSGYIFLPEENKWKLVGTCRIDGQWSSIKSPATFYSADKRSLISTSFSNAWVQRSTGSWKKLSSDAGDVRPVINPMPNVDSVQQYQHDKEILDKALAAGQTDVSNNIEGVHYKIINAGSGKAVFVTDTVTVHYRLRIFNTTEIINETSEKPATFPLNILIKAWQLAIPLVKTGGKLKIVIPSGLAYSIRTRAPKIPPNSILEFEIEVLDTKPANQ